MKYRSEAELTIRNAYIDGFRPYVVYPDHGFYRGCYRKSSLHGYGVKTYTKSHLVYDGEWEYSKCNGQGTLRRVKENGMSERIYVGQWRDGKRCGEGKMFHRRGTYYGWWKDNKPWGKGIMWYNDGSIYLGEWENGLYDGAGVLFYANGNRYEGFFEKGLKHGEGLYFHNETGQVQKGVWVHDYCKTSIMFDEFRNQVKLPTPYSIPECKLADPDLLMKELFREYMPPISTKTKLSVSCIDLLTKIRMKFLDLRI